MVLTLPPVKEGVNLRFEHFPTAMQCFIYRNWEIVEPLRMAEVLGTDTETVLKLAGDMGLPVPPVVDPIWYKAGYISIIRANWHLLTYEQLGQLLGWDMEKLAYIIKEDDFLDVKLGRFKPDTPELKYAPLTPEQIRQTEFIRKATLEALSRFDPVTVKPFDFKQMFKRTSSLPEFKPQGKERFDTRIVYSYCALYGDTFINGMEHSFPDELLEAYSAIGVNGIWSQAVLYTLIPFPFAPELSENYEKRLDGLRTLTQKMDKYGIKLYLYINEPRSMPNSFFEKHHELKGHTRDGFSTLCTSTPEIQKYLRDGAAYLAGQVPLLGGFITITASENMTNCYSHANKETTTCPRCSEREKYEVIAELNTIIYEGAASVNPDIRLLAWTWAWNPSEINATIDNMPENIGVMCVSETDMPKTIGNIKTQVSDYSISIVGPGEAAVNVWKHANETGHRAYAKCQFNNTWECAAVPFIPVFEQIYKHMCGLIASGVGGLMLDWTLGGYPSLTFGMIRKMFFESETIPPLHELYCDIFPKESVDTVEKAVHLFSDAFDKYPFHISTLYTGPQNVGSSNLLYPKKTGLNATMVCYAYDALNNWRAIYPEDVFENQFRLLSEEWAQGLEELSKLDSTSVNSSPALKELIDAAEASYCHFRSVYMQIRFVRMRDSGKDYSSVVDEETELCVRLANVSAHNPTIGYESSNHYFYNRYALLEKYVCCKYIKNL